MLCQQEHRAGVAQVEEESDGWYRLRTVARHWSSDEDEKVRSDIDSEIEIVRSVCAETEGVQE